jgi:hypothetical protein
MGFDWANAYPSQRSPVFARNVVATSHPLAAQAGLRILQQGGNAVDAAITTAACMTLVEPCSNGLGSDAFALVWDGAQLHGLNASGASAAGPAPRGLRRLTDRPARLGRRHRAGRGGRLGGAAPALRAPALCRADGAGHRDRRARLRGAGRRGRQMGACRPGA